jgi:hypothetical protein
MRARRQDASVDDDQRARSRRGKRPRAVDHQIDLEHDDLVVTYENAKAEAAE